MSKIDVAASIAAVDIWHTPPENGGQIVNVSYGLETRML